MKQKSESMKPDATVAPGASTAATDVIGRTPMVPKEPVSSEEVTRRPVEAQATEAGGVAGELVDHAKYRADFGVYAPDPERLAASLKRAQGLTEEAARQRVGSARQRPARPRLGRRPRPHGPARRALRPRRRQERHRRPAPPTHQGLLRCARRDRRPRRRHPQEEPREAAQVASTRRTGVQSRRAISRGDHDDLRAMPNHPPRPRPTAPTRSA